LRFVALPSEQKFCPTGYRVILQEPRLRQPAPARSPRSPLLHRSPTETLAREPATVAVSPPESWPTLPLFARRDQSPDAPFPAATVSHAETFTPTPPREPAPSVNANPPTHAAQDPHIRDASYCHGTAYATKSRLFPAASVS